MLLAVSAKKGLFRVVPERKHEIPTSIPGTVGRSVLPEEG